MPVEEVTRWVVDGVEYETLALAETASRRPAFLAYVKKHQLPERMTADVVVDWVVKHREEVLGFLRPIKMRPMADEWAEALENNPGITIEFDDGFVGTIRNEDAG